MKRDYIKIPVDWLNDPRYGTLTDDLWRLVMQLNMLAGEVDSDGLLPAVRDMAWELHIGLGTLQISLHHLCERGLVHQTPQGWVVTGFKESQAAPNSTERSRAFRKRRKSATQDEEDGNDAAVQESARCTIQDSARCTGQESARCATQDRTYDASERQLLRPYPVVGPVVDPVPAPDPAPAGSKRVTKGRHRHKTKMQPVEKPVNPVDNFVDNCPVDGFPQEKGRKISDSSAPGTSSTSILTKYLKTSLNIKLPLLELPDQPDLETESEKFRPSQGKTLENSLNAPGSEHFAGARQVPPARTGQGAQQSGVASENLREPVEKPVDNYPVDGFPQEKGRKISDPDDIPP